MGVVQRHTVIIRGDCFRGESADRRPSRFDPKQRRVQQERIQVRVAHEQLVSVRNVPIPTRVELVRPEQHLPVAHIVQVSALIDVGARQ